MTGRQIGAAEALRMGLADRVVRRNDVLGTALAMAAEFAAGPAGSRSAHPSGSIDDGLDTALEAGLAIEREAFVGVLATEDAERGDRSFLEQRARQGTFVGR